jgi:hypothetical protein
MHTDPAPRMLRQWPRPATPRAVLAWFAGDLDGLTLAAHLAALEADPAWGLLAHVGADRIELELSHLLGHERLVLRLEAHLGPNGLLWRRVD